MDVIQDIFKTLSLPEFYFAMFRSATPVLLTTLGAMISSRSGTSNIALEGTMLISAFVGVVVSAFSQSAWIGFLGAVFAGFVISNILAYFILKLKSNAVISGIAINTLASGGTIFALYLITGEKVGIPVKRVKYIALVFSGILTGMAGAFLSMGYVGLFSSGMTAGRGYIALATQAIAAGNAVVGMLASMLFGFCQSLSNYLQSSGVPLQFIQLMPYLIIVIAYTVFCAMRERKKRKKQMQAAAGK